MREDPQDGIPGRAFKSGTGSLGGSFGKSRGSRVKKSGGGFLLGMGGGFAMDVSTSDL